MSALNSLPLPVVRLLAFFHEELSERRPGRVPQTMQLWVGCLLVILISMTFEIPFVALSLAVLFYGIQLTRKCSASALRQSLILSHNNERAQLPAITGGQAAGVLS